MTRRMTKPSAVVVGGGVVGAAAALGLAQAGVRVHLVEAGMPRRWSAETAPDLRVYAVAPASQALFARLGVWPAVRAAHAAPYRRMRVWDAAAAGELRFDAASAGQEALGWIVEQRVLVHALWSALEQTRGVRIDCPARVAQVAQDDDGVRVTLEDGDTLRAQLLVAADGAASPIRAALGIGTDEHAYAQQGVVAYVDHAEPHADTAWQRFLPGGPLAVLPFAERRSSIVWTLPDEAAARMLALPDDAFAAELERAFDARLGPIRGVGPRAAFPLRRRIAQRFVEGRVVLAGDAAHAVHPLAGQGVNLGLADVASLLQAVQRGVALAGDAAHPSALRRHARTRRSAATVAAHGFEWINRAFSNDALLPTLLRGPVLGLADRLAPLKRVLAEHAAGWR